MADRIGKPVITKTAKSWRDDQAVFKHDFY